jgi:hypothetical protein
MPDDDKPNPIEDVRKGLGLLFRAAKGAVEKLPTKDVEELVVTSAREVGRALENVGKSIEREVIRVKDDLKPRGSATPPVDAPPPQDKQDAEHEKHDETKPPTGGAN